jgi:hypothetical protein
MVRRVEEPRNNEERKSSVTGNRRFGAWLLPNSKFGMTLPGSRDCDASFVSGRDCHARLFRKLSLLSPTGNMPPDPLTIIQKRLD